MIRNSVKHKLREGGVSIGTMLFEFNTTGIAHRRQRGCRLRSVRHGTLWLEHRNDSNADCHHAEVRAGSDRPHPGNRVSLRRERARHGSDGSHDPDVRERDEARRLVSSAKYPPVGRRGAAFAIAHDDYRGSSIPETVQSANDETLLIAQIETARGMENVEEIAAVPGIDALWIGLYDLTLSLGIPGEMNHPKVLAATDRVFAACHANNIVPAVLVTSIAEGEAQIARGFKMIAYGGDLWLYQSVLRIGIKKLHEQQSS